MSVGRVLVCDPHFPLDAVRELLAGLDVAVEPAPAPVSGADVVALLTGPDYPLRETDLRRLPRLRIVATSSVGYDHIDIAAAARRGAWVTNVPDYCIEEMADSTIALLLALLRGIVVLDRSVRSGEWDYAAAGELRRVTTTRLGVIGFGRIGRAVAARARALGLEVWATDPAVRDETVAAAGVTPAKLHDLLRSCNALSLHLPLTPETEGLVGERELALAPRGSVLVNTARARLVDQDALLRALATGQLAAAALDVLPVEPPTAEAPVPQAPNLIVTPHAAWYSREAEREVFRRPVLAVRAVLAGGVPADAVSGPAVST